jgi:hypothetical protein
LKHVTILAWGLAARAVHPVRCGNLTMPWHPSGPAITQRA